MLLPFCLPHVHQCRGNRQPTVQDRRPHGRDRIQLYFPLRKDTCGHGLVYHQRGRYFQHAWYLQGICLWDIDHYHDTRVDTLAFRQQIKRPHARPAAAPTLTTVRVVISSTATTIDNGRRKRALRVLSITTYPFCRLPADVGPGAYAALPAQTSDLLALSALTDQPLARRGASVYDGNQTD